MRLFPSVRQMTTFFGVAILCVTVLIFALRLTVFSNITADDPPVFAAPSTIETSGGGTFEYRMNRTIECPAPGERASFQIENPATNTGYMRVEILRGDTGKSLYYSGYIAPGSGVDTAFLQGDPLQPGEYSCKAVISAYDLDTKEKIGSQEQPVTIVIEENGA